MTEIEFNALAAQGYNRIPLTGARTIADITRDSLVRA